MQSIQNQLDNLALQHHEEEEQNNSLRFDSESALTTDQIKEIQAITSSSVYVLITQTSSEYRYGMYSFNEKSRIYSLEANVIDHYPYLTKFGNWVNIFKQVDHSVYRINYKDLKWLNKRNKDFLQKQRMK